MTLEIWSDLHHAIEIGTDGGVRKVINADAVKSSIDNILRTSLGERVMHPEFGSSLRGLIFQPLTDSIMTRIVSATSDALRRWDDRVSVESLNLAMDPDNNKMSIELRCSILGIGDVIEQSILF